MRNRYQTRKQSNIGLPSKDNNVKTVSLFVWTESIFALFIDQVMAILFTKYNRKNLAASTCLVYAERGSQNRFNNSLRNKRYTHFF